MMKTTLLTLFTITQLSFFHVQAMQEPMRGDDPPIAQVDQSSQELLLQKGITSWLSDLWIQRLAESKQLPPCKEFPEIGTERASFCWSPDSARLAISCGEKIILWYPLTNQSSIFIGIKDGWEPGNFTYLTWSPDGSLLALAYHETVTIIDPGTGECLRTLESDQYALNAPAIWSPDSTRLVVTALESFTKIFNPHTGECVEKFEHTDANQVVWSPDGAYIAFWSKDDEYSDDIQVWNTQTWTLVYKKRAQLARWTPDNTLLIYNCHSIKASEITTWNPRTSEEHNTVVDYVNLLSISPRGRHCASYNQATETTGTLGIWDFKTGGHLYDLLVDGLDGELVHEATWSPDGCRVVFDVGGNIKIWFPGTGAPSCTLPSRDHRTSLWSPDGAHLVAYGWGDITNDLGVWTLLDPDIIKFLKTITPRQLEVLAKIKNKLKLDGCDQALYKAFPACLHTLLGSQGS